MKIQYQTVATIEVDTDTGRSRLVKAWTQMLGEGNRTKAPKKEVKTVEATKSEVKWLS